MAELLRDPALRIRLAMQIEDETGSSFGVELERLGQIHAGTRNGSDDRDASSHDLKDSSTASAFGSGGAQPVRQLLRDRNSCGIQTTLLTVGKREWRR